MLIIQFRTDWQSTGEWQDMLDIDVGPGVSTHTLRMPPFGQSDRLYADPGYGANCLVDCDFNITVERDFNTNRITVSNASMTNWYFNYDRTADVGRRVIPGDYEYWAVHDGIASSIYRYMGPDVVIDSFRDYIPYGQTIADVFISEPESVSNEIYYGRCYNHVNGNDVHVYLRIRNSYPASYRPGATMHGGHWKTHDRGGGYCHIRTNGSWLEMRTFEGKGLEDPPSILRNGGWGSQHKVGEY